MIDRAQQDFLQVFGNLKRNAIISRMLQDRYSQFAWWLDLSVALITSTAVAGWLTETASPAICSTIVVAGQVLILISNRLPWRERASAFQSIRTGQDTLCLVAEDQWFSVSRAMKTEEETHSMSMRLKERENELVTKYLKDSTVPSVKRVEKSAMIEAELFMMKFDVENKESM